MFQSISKGVLATVSGAIMLVATSNIASATVITLGQQDFTDGTLPEFTAYNAAQIGEPAPFDGFKASDPGGTFFSESWTFNFAPEAPVSANVMLGLFDHDCFSGACNVVGSFTVDGNDFTAVLNGLLQTTGTFANSAYDIVTIDLSSISGDFADGVLNMSLAMLSGGGVPGGAMPGNGMGLDFAKLTTTAVPEPGMLAIFGLGLAGLGFARRRKTA